MSKIRSKNINKIKVNDVLKFGERVVGVIKIDASALTDVKKYDIIIVVSCSDEIQEKRVLKRKNWNKERFEKTLEKQIPNEKKKQLANLIIRTDRGKRYLWEQVIKIIKLVFIKFHWFLHIFFKLWEDESIVTGFVK